MCHTEFDDGRRARRAAAGSEPTPDSATGDSLLTRFAVAVGLAGTVASSQTMPELQPGMRVWMPTPRIEVAHNAEADTVAHGCFCDGDLHESRE